MNQDEDRPQEPTPAAKRHALLSKLLTRALALEADARADFLHEACEGDVELETELRGLLRHADSTAVDEFPTLELGPHGKSPGAQAQRLRPDEIPGGTRISGYRVIRVIGEGGMGIVYEAEQESLHRRVALKVIRGLGSSKDSLLRFAREADILARLQHPGICQVYEIGRLDVRTPFIAMELIQGLPLLEHAERHQLDRNARLALACRIADAAAHAHERGIVHRDLKPDNILVTADGQPKIVDFGVARASEMTAGSTFLTSTGAIVGTVAYMSPEQAAGQRDVDHRADIFSLGVISFELLSGQLPMSLEGLSLPQALHVIQSGELSLAGSGVPTLRGDLETILGKAMERDPERRYQDAESLAADIRRHLDHEPIIARPPSIAYRVSKFTQRHRVFVTAIAIAFSALAIGTTVALREARRAGSESRRASERAELAERQSYRAILQAAAGALAADHPREARDELAQAPLTPRGWEGDYLEALVGEQFGIDIWDGTAWGATFSEDGSSLFALSGEAHPRELLHFATPGFELVGRHSLDARPLLIPQQALQLAIEGVLRSRPQGDELEIREAPSGALLQSIRTCPVSGQHPRFLPNPVGSGLAVIEVDEFLRACDLRTGEMLPLGIVRELNAHLAPDAPELLVTTNQRARVVDLLSGAVAWEAPDSSDGSSSATFSHDGASIYTAGLITDPFLRKWSRASGELQAERRFEGTHGREPWAFSADGSVLAIGAHDRTVHVFDTELRNQLALRALRSVGPCRLSLDRQGRHLVASAIGRPGLQVFARDGPRVQARLAGHETYVYTVAFSPDGSSLASAGWDNTVRTWDRDKQIATGVLRAEGLGHVQRVLWPRGGTRILALSIGTLFAFDAATGAPLSRTQLSIRDEEAKPYLAEHPTLDLIAVASGGSQGVQLLNSKTLEIVDEMETALQAVWSPDGLLLATTQPDSGLVMRDARDLGILWAHAGDGSPGKLAWSPDGRSIARLGAEQFTILDAREGTVLRRFPVRDHVMCFAWSPSGRRIVSGDVQGGLNFWNVETGSLVLRLQEHAAYVMDLAFSPDGLTLATASGDGDVRLWNARVSRAPRF